MTAEEERQAAFRHAWKKAATVCGPRRQRDARQNSLADLLTAIILDPRVPPDVASRLGEVVVLANEIGQGNP